MSFEVLEELTEDWVSRVPAVVSESGAASLLRTARSLFKHAWFDYEFMVVACVVGFQAMEAAFRELYPDADRKPFMALVRQARDEGILPPEIADLAETGVELRNLFSHPMTQSAFTLGMAAPMLENTHRMVGLVLTAATSRSVE